MIARSISWVEGAVSGKAKGGSGSGDGKVAMESATVHGVGAEGDDRVQIAEYW